ncbi:MAG: glycosyltransferase family 39 protein [Candidatus Pacebacteria bacterium]|nr:glycosyltransferase family 39 protein [Candidatus Paceibacterota bacterium]
MESGKAYNPAQKQQKTDLPGWQSKPGRSVFFAASKQAWWAVLICVFFGAVSFFSVSGFNFRDLKYSGDSITSDEVPHLTSGYYYLESGRYFLNPEHPPLVKDVSAVLIRLFLNPDFPEVSYDAPFPSEAEKEDLFFNKKIFPRVLEIENYHWDNRMLIFNPQSNPDLIILLARLSVIIFNSTLLFLLYLMLRKNFGQRTSLIALFLLSFSPLSFAHASLVTTDFASSVLQMSALGAFAFYLYLFSNDRKYKWWLGLSAFLFAAAYSAKFSSLAMLAPAFLGGAAYLAVRGFKRTSRTDLDNDYQGRSLMGRLAVYAIQYATLAIISLALTIGFYAAHVYNSDGEGIKSQLQANYPAKFPDSGKEILFRLADSNIFGRAAATYAIGISMVVNRVDSAGQSAYFMGKIYGSEGAGVWYFPVLYLLKLPLPIHFLSFVSLLLFIISVIFLIFKKPTRDVKNSPTPRVGFKNGLLSYFRTISPLSFVLAAFLAVFSYEALNSRLNIGIRHFMPAIFAALTLTAAGIGRYWNFGLGKFLTVRNVFFASALVVVFSAALSFPHYLSYYNLAGGGTDNGYKIATDSNYDWGQDVKRLGKWIKENNIETVYVDIFSLNAPKYYFGENFRYFNLKNDPPPPSGSYIAVSAMNLQNNIYDKNIPPEKKYSIFKNNLEARVGKTIFIFKTP